LQALLPGAAARALPLAPKALAAAAPGAALVVNCTSAGMSPNDETLPWFEEVPFPAGAVLYDLVYKPRRTRLMRLAEAAGARAVGGLGMLAEQGAAAFDRWTAGAHSPEAIRRIAGVMRAALEYP
jgi:shikimate dehydrogenase